MYATIPVLFKLLELLIKIIKRNLFEGDDIKIFINDFNKLRTL